MKVASIVKETYQTVDSRSTSLNSDQEDMIVAHLATWFEGARPLKNSYIKLKGGRDGVDFDNERKREAIRQEIRKALGLSLVSDEVSGFSYALPTIQVF